MSHCQMTTDITEIFHLVALQNNADLQRSRQIVLIYTILREFTCQNGCLAGVDVYL